MVETSGPSVEQYVSLMEASGGLLENSWALVDITGAQNSWRVSLLFWRTCSNLFAAK